MISKIVQFEEEIDVVTPLELLSFYENEYLVVLSGSLETDDGDYLQFTVYDQENESQDIYVQISVK